MTTKKGKKKYYKLYELEIGEYFEVVSSKMKGVLTDISQTSADVLIFHVPESDHPELHDRENYKRFWIGKKNIATETEVRKIKRMKPAKSA